MNARFGIPQATPSEYMFRGNTFTRGLETGTPAKRIGIVESDPSLGDKSYLWIPFELLDAADWDTEVH